MDTFLKAAAGILTALIIWLSLNKYNKEASTLITMAAGAMVTIVALSFIKPIVDFIWDIQAVGNIDKELITVLLRVVGIGMIAELCMLICKDAGNESMGRALQFLSSAVAIWMAIPVFQRLLNLMQTILGTV